MSPERGEELLRLLSRIGDRPDIVARERDGSVTAVWKDRNHFLEDEGFLEVRAFLDRIGAGSYAMETIDEDWCSETSGGYRYGFGTRIEYEVYGDPVDLGAVSRNIIAKGGRGATKAKTPSEGPRAPRTVKPGGKKAQPAATPRKPAATRKKGASSKPATAGAGSGGRTGSRSPIRFADPAARRRRWASAGRSAGGTPGCAAESAATWRRTPTWP